MSNHIPYKAMVVAKHWHRLQMYGDQPYMYHVMQVHDLVVEVYGVEAYELRAIALLHDIIEDTPYPVSDLYMSFGTEIGNAVLAMSKREGEDYFEYIARVKANPLARKVKRCDSMCNLTQSFKEQRHKGIVKYTTVLQLLEVD